MKINRLSTFGKITVTIIMSIIMVWTFFGITTIMNMNNVNGDTQTEYVEIKVQPGDTLWSIAQSNCNKETDIRDLIYEICQINDTSAKELTPGQILHIPCNIN